MDIIVLKPFTALLPTGPCVMRPGQVLLEADYDATTWQRILDASGDVSGRLNYPAGSTIDDAGTAAIERRMRGGDDDNQTQGDMQGAVIRQWD